MAGRITRSAILLAVVALGVSSSDGPPATPGVQEIVARSVAAVNADWAARPRYDFTERDRLERGTKTYHVKMILGSPYYDLIAVNGKPVHGGEAKIEHVIATRRAESPGETARRMENYRKDRARDHLMMSQLTSAFDFVLVGRRKLGPYQVYVLKATPRKDYRPPNMETEVLTGMEGTMWIDQKTFQWVKVEAHVVRPVSIEGFLARVEPGTYFELEKAPVAPGVWLPSHFEMRSRARILYTIAHHTEDNETYSGYTPTPADMQTADADPSR